MAPLSTVLGGEGLGVRGRHTREMHPSPQPLSPEYRGEGPLKRSPLFGEELPNMPVQAPRFP
jgi:hypothetical protein